MKKNKKKLFDKEKNGVKKKPFYKKMWFWIIIILLFAIGSTGDNSSSDEKASVEEYEIEEVAVEEEKEEEAEIESEELEPVEEEIEEKDVTTLDTLIEETHIEDYIVDEETGVTLVSAPVTDVLGGKIGVEGFNQEMWNTLEDYNELFPDGVMYLGYGDINGEDYNKIRTYFSRETLDNIDFSKVIVEGESIVYADRYNITGFGEIELNYNSSNSDTYSVEDGNPLDNLWMFSTVEKIEGNK